MQACRSGHAWRLSWGGERLLASRRYAAGLDHHSWSMDTIKSWQRVVRYKVEDARGQRRSRSQVDRDSSLGQLGLRQRAYSNLKRPFRRLFRWLGMPFAALGYHHILMLLTASSIVLLAVMLAGCSSANANIPNIWLLRLSYQPSDCPFDSAVVNPSLRSMVGDVARNGSLEVRMGYFGVCIRENGQTLICSNDVAGLARMQSPERDPLNLIQTALTTKNRIVFPWLIIIAVALNACAILALASFPGWHEEADPRTGSEVDIKPFPSRPVAQSTTAIMFASSVLLLVSALWQHVASVAVAAIVRDQACQSVTAEVGPAIVVLGWTAFGVCVTVTVGILIMVLSIALLDRLVDD